MFELTYRCNFKCKHCYLPPSYKKNHKNELTTDGVISIIDQLRKMGVYYLGFTGGEPFIRKDFFDILRHAKKKGFQIIIYTNGSLIDEKSAAKLARLKPNKIEITIPAIDKTAFASITGTDGYRDKVFRAISILQRKKVKLGLKTCVLKKNRDEIRHIRYFASFIKAGYRVDAMLFPRLDGNKRPCVYQDEFALNDARLSFCDESDYLSPTAGRLPPGNCYLFKCGVGRIEAAITPYGELKPCLMIDRPRFKILDPGSSIDGSFARTNLASNSGLSEAWCHLKKFISSIKPDKNYKCGGCRSSNYCKWCPARAWLYNKTFTSCIWGSRKNGPVYSGKAIK